MEQEELNKLLENKYKIHIINENNEYYYKLSDIYNITMSDMAECYSREYNKNIIYGHKGCRYLNKEGLIFVLSHAENGLKEEFIKYNSFFKYDNKLYFNQEAIELIKEYSNDLVYTIENEQILFRAMDIVEKFFKNTSINIFYIRKYFQSYLYKIKYRKSLYVNMEGIKILQFIHNNNFKSINFLKEYNPYYDHNLFKDSIFKNTKRFIKDKVIYYKLKDLSNHINSFGSVSTIVDKYITEYKSFDNLEEYYLNQKQIVEFIEKANTTKSINLCIKYKLNNKLVNKLNLEEFIYEDKIILPKRKIHIRTFTYEDRHILFCLQDIYKLLGYYTLESLSPYTLHIKHFREFISEQDFKMLLEKKIENIEMIGRTQTISDIMYLSNKLNLNITINNKDILNKVFEENEIKLFKNNLKHFEELFKIKKFDPIATKDFKFLVFEKKTYVFITDILNILFDNTKDKFGNRFKLVIIKNETDVYIKKVMEFELFMNYLTRMKKIQAVKIREEFGMVEKFSPIFENTTLPIIESSFPNVEFERQYKVKYGEKNNQMYYLDMAIVKYKIDIECDEDDHKTYSSISEKKRTEFLIKQGWIQLRYNPTIPETIGKVISDIIVILKNNNAI